MRRRVFRWTVGNNPRLIKVGAASKTKKIEGRNGTVVGLDLSLTASAACAMPLGWDQNLKKLRTHIFGYKLEAEAPQKERIARMVSIADGILEFCREVQARFVYCEDHAFGAGGRNANQTIEMTGIVKARLFDEWGVVVQPIVVSSARKTLLQHVPRGVGKGFAKKFTVRNVKRLGGPTASWTEDEVDAFVVTNHGLMLLGGTAMTFEGE